MVTMTDPMANGTSYVDVSDVSREPMPTPNPMVRHCVGRSLAKAPITKVNEQPARPKPISTPADM